MSFLAQLRQRSSQTSALGVQLTYQLRVQSGELVLRLALAQVENGRLKAAGQDYVIQPSHLHAAPPFFTDVDQRVVSAMFNLSPAWQQSAELSCASGLSWAVLIEAVKTNKVFFLTPSQRWCALVISSDWPVSWCWQVQPDGAQKLARHVPENATICQIGKTQCALAVSGELHLLADAPRSTTVALGTTVPAIALNEFLEDNQTVLVQDDMPLPQRLSVKTCPAQLRCVLICRPLAQSSVVSLDFRYATEHFCVALDGADDSTCVSLWDGKVVHLIERDTAAENRALFQVSAFLREFRTLQNGLWSSENPQRWKRLLLRDRPKLGGMGITIEVLPGFEHHYVDPQQWSVDVRHQDGAMQFALTFQTADKAINALNVLNEIHNGAEWWRNEEGDVELRIDGVTVVLPGRLGGFLLDEFADLMAWQKLDMPIPLTQWYRLQSLKSGLPETTQWTGDLQLLEQASQLVRVPAALNTSQAGIKAELRSYQQLGVAWLQHLRANGVNGLLADDMGLGKTLQTIVHLALEFKSGRAIKPALIVAPTSLLHNWAKECQKFCPGLKVCVIHGSKRHDLWQAFEEFQVVITSYHLAVQDLALWLERRLSWLVLDEAQNIKNPRTQIRKAVIQLNADYRLCLSGTPVENHLQELWSVMDFLAPGILGTLAQFRSYYQKPIEQQANSARFEQLLQRLAPLMLRRTKAQVATDLPQKTIIVKSVALPDEQVKFYETVKHHSWLALEKELTDEQNSGQQQIRILSAITKLRQVCCDPRLLGERQVPSAKTQLCVEMILELVSEGRSVLVFSQFTSMLNILSEHLATEAIDHFMLTGQTQNRGQLVDAFQAGEKPVFLISLKAGGVGLNLTRADTVIHFDPWWNQAAEQQASDRAHRIGQTQPVFVYKLIAENTIEEKIAKMQDAKALLTNQVQQQAEVSGQAFALSVKDLLQLWQDEE